MLIPRKNFLVEKGVFRKFVAEVVCACAIIAGGACLTTAWADSLPADNTHEIAMLYEKVHVLKNIKNRLEHLGEQGLCEDVEMNLYADCAAWKYGFYVNSKAERDFVLGFVVKELKRVNDRIVVLQEQSKKECAE